MRLRITQHGVSCNECNHQGFNPEQPVFEHYFLSIFFNSNCIYIYIIIPKCACVFVHVLFENG